MRSRIIEKEQAGTPDRFDFPSVDASAADALRGAQKGSAHLLTAGQLDALQRQVHDEAFQRGFNEGLAAGKAELAHDASLLHAAIAECLSVLSSTVRDVTIYLNPEDAAIVRAHAASGEAR